MRRGRREKGFALILALWSIALCAAAAGYGLQKSQRLSQNYAAELAIARAGMALRAGEAIARDAIWRAARAGGDPTGSRRSVFGDFNVRIAIEDEARKLNPNDADPAAMAAAFQAMGARAADAAAMSQRIADFLDRDNQARPQGVEAPDYIRAGLLPPKNAPIRNLKELWGVLGFAAFATGLGPGVDITESLTVAARGVGRFGGDPASGLQSDRSAAPDVAPNTTGGPFRVRIDVSAREDRSAAASTPSVARSVTLIVSAP